jgi:hypothetical protein
VGTKIRLTRSGGLAGISMVASVDLDELPEATAEKIRAALDDLDFDPPEARAGGPSMPDAYQYDLVVTNRTRRTVTAHDPFLSPGLRALVDVLLPLAEPE